MDNLVCEILKFKEEVVDFKGKFNVNSVVFTEEEINLIKDDATEYENNLQLKKIIERKANGNYEDHDLNFWIINNWGGIWTFKNNEVNKLKIITFKSELKKGELSKPIFETISSLSKLSAFYEPHKYIIYDSRVVYTLNWLLLKTKNTQYRFFPMPESRNAKLKKYDLSTLINLINVGKETNELYYDFKDAYFRLCDLVKELSERVFEDEAYPYHMEMLLFHIADSKILDEIKAKVKVTIE